MTAIDVIAISLAVVLAIAVRIRSRSVTCRLRIKGFVDRRSPALLEAARALEQAKADKALEDLFNMRVALNQARRDARSEVPLFLRLAS